MCSVKTRSVYFVDWESTSKEFVKGIKFSSPRRETIVHLFYNKNTLKSSLPPDCDWIVKHPTLTSSPEATWTALITCMIHFYTHRAHPCTESVHCRLRTRHHVHIKFKAYIVCGDEARYAELAAILKHNKVRKPLIYTWSLSA